MKISNSILSLKAVVFLIACCCFMNVNAQLPPLKECMPSLIPAFAATCGSPNGSFIRSVTTTGGMNNIANTNTNCGNTTTSYSDYTSSGMYVKQEALKTVDINVVWATNNTTANLSAITKIYIDWNRNGYFEPGEYTVPVFQLPSPNPHVHPSNGSSVTVKVTVPGFAKEGQTRMRIITASAGPIYDFNLAPCLGNRGEAEDYVFEVVNPCLPPNVISIANLNYKSADFAWTPKLNAEFYEYIITPVDTIPHDTVSGFTFTTNNSVDVDTFKCDTKYYTLVRVICDTAGKIAKNWKRSSWIRDSFMTEPCCYTPVITVDKVSSTTARVSWDPIATALGYEYAVSTTPDPPQKGTFTINNVVFLQGLPGKTTLFVHVRSRCTPTPLSDWSKSAFKTMPYTSVNSLSGDEKFSVNVYPNPVSNDLSVQLSEEPANNAMLELMDITGRIIYKTSVVMTKTNVNMTHFSNGTYIVRYTDDAHNQVIKIDKY